MNPKDEHKPPVSEASFSSGLKEEYQFHKNPGSETEAREVTRRSIFDQKKYDQKKKLTEQLTETARALRQSGDQMPNNSTAGLIRMSADTIDRMGNYLRNRSVDDILGDAQAYARRRPWWVVGGAFVAGLAVARFMKSSARPSHPSSTSYRPGPNQPLAAETVSPASGMAAPSGTPGRPPSSGF
ncbi:MAG: hypothetical protein ACOWWM_15925 [Desulfobacterales bacterium]